MRIWLVVLALLLCSRQMSVAANPPSRYEDIWRFSEAMALVENGRVVEVWKGSLKVGEAAPHGTICMGHREVLVRAHERWTCDTVDDIGLVVLAGPSEGEAPPSVTVEQLRHLGKTGKLPAWRVKATVLGRSVVITYDEEDRRKPIIVRGLVAVDLEATRLDFYPDSAYFWLKSPKRTVYLKGRVDKVNGGEVQCTFGQAEPAARSIAELEALLK